MFVGAGLVSLWAMAVATVPRMIKGSDTARKMLVSANVVGIGLFGWQVVTGIPILLEVLDSTSWPQSTRLDTVRYETEAQLLVSDGGAPSNNKVP
jgi:Protein of unknown function (DUF4079)